MTVLVTSCRLMSSGQTTSSCSMVLSYKVTSVLFIPAAGLARMFHELLAATADMAVLPGVLGCRTLRRTVQVRLGSNPAVPRDGFPVVRPSSRSRDSNSRNIRANGGVEIKSLGRRVKQAPAKPLPGQGCVPSAAWWRLAFSYIL